MNFELTELQYADTGDGPWRLYIFDRNGFYKEKPWFRRVDVLSGPTFPNEEITIESAVRRTAAAISLKLEVRITDGGDMLVYHAKDGKVLYGEDFWKEVGQ